MNIKSSRAASFAVVTLIYIAASAVGIFMYTLLPYALWLNLLLADVAATLAVFAFSLIFQNALVYDPYWSVQPMVIVCAFALTLPRVLILSSFSPSPALRTTYTAQKMYAPGIAAERRFHLE